MNVLFDIGHPGHVHLFKNTAETLKQNGHRVYFSTKKRQNITYLLDKYKFDYTLLGRKYDSQILKYFSSVFHLARMFLLVRSKKIEVGLGVSGLLAFVSKYTSMDSICLDDDDSAATPLFAKSIQTANVIFTPAALKNDQRGAQHLTYESYHELGYLHPNQFTPDPNVIQALGLTKGEAFFILRFNAFKAHHDDGEYGMGSEQKHKLIEFLLPYGRVFVSSEIASPDFDKYKLNIKPEQIHSALYFATMFVGDSQTMCSEASVLGTPAFKCNTFAKRLSIPNELEDKHGLCYAFKPEEFEGMLDRIKRLLNAQLPKETHKTHLQKMLSEKIDLTALLVWFVENYPASKQIMKENMAFQERFK